MQLVADQFEMMLRWRDINMPRLGSFTFGGEDHRHRHRVFKPRDESRPERRCNMLLAEDRKGVIGAESLKHGGDSNGRSEEHTTELQSLMSTSYAVLCMKNIK